MIKVLNQEAARKAASFLFKYCFTGALTGKGFGVVTAE